MQSFDETYHLSLKQGENVYEKENHIGIALCSTGCQCERQGTVPCLDKIGLKRYNYQG